MEQSNEHLIQKVLEAYQLFSGFTRELQQRSRQSGISPYPYQAMRVYEATRNGTKRLLIWDTTSAGKTYTASLIKGLEDEQRLKDGKKQSRAIVLSPES